MGWPCASLMSQLLDPMLHRVLEPEVMDTPEEARAYDDMDHSEVNRRFVDDFLEFVDGSAVRSDAAGAAGGAGSEPLSGEILDVGAGTAQIPIELARRSDRFRIWAIDLSVAMLELARRNVEIAGLRHLIRTDLVDAKGLPYADNHFAAVISNSIIHHIPEPGQVLLESWRTLAPGGAIFFRDLARPDNEQELARIVDVNAAGATGHQRKLFAESLHAALSLDEVRGLVRSLGLDPTAATLTSDRHWTFRARK